LKSLNELSDGQLREKIAKVRCFLLDMDGTFYLGDELFEGSLDFLKAVQASGRSFAFLTNNSSRGTEHYIKKLAAMGVFIGEEQMLSSGQAAAMFLLREYEGKRVFLLGNESLRAEMERFGIEIDQKDPEIVLIGFDTSLDYPKMCAVCDFVRAGLPYIATHPDFNCPTETGFIPDIGAIIAFIEASAGRRPDLVVGKPHGEIVRAATERTGLRAEEMAMVGDRLYTDIKTGLDHGLLSIMVLTGEGTIEEIEKTGIEPEVLVQRLADLIPYL
jgi:HAD superfamily hydrolase (TIGR01450 family)